MSTSLPEPLATRLAGGKLSYFRGAVGYSSLFKGGEDPAFSPPVICSNPYLEGPFGPADQSGVDRFIPQKGRASIGLKSNCVSCHRAAAYLNAPIPNQPDINYWDFGLLDPRREDVFKNRLKTNYIWGLANTASE